MASIQLRDKTLLSDFGQPYFVAEVNSSHNGDVDVAKKMIDSAVESGCSCVKFQSWSAETLYSTTYYRSNPISKRIVSKFSLSEKQLKDLAEYCHRSKIGFSSTPYSNQEVDFLLDECGASYVKVASMDLNNYPFLRYIARKNAPIVLSTGMSTLEEISRAVEIIEAEGNYQLCLLHCISIYPPEFQTVNLNNILGLREMFPDYPIGFSDHSLGVEMSVAAVVLGAALIEKHLTLDRKKIGMDNQMATEPEEMMRLVQCCKNTQLAMGGKERIVLAAELEQMKKMRRSVIVTRNLPAGSILTMDNLSAKRPGTGIPVDKLDSLVGRTLVREVEQDTLLQEEDLK